MGIFSSTLRDRRGVVAIEFAFVAPILVLLLGAIADYALLTWSRAELASDVAQGGQFAYDKGRTVTAAQVAQIVQTAGSLSGVTANVSGPACYCVSAGPALTISPCTTVCPDGTAQNYYISISANYNFSSMIPIQFMSTSRQLIDTSTVRLQ